METKISYFILFLSLRHELLRRIRDSENIISLIDSDKYTTDFYASIGNIKIRKRIMVWIILSSYRNLLKFSFLNFRYEF